MKHFEVKKWVRSQTALKETVTFNKLLQHAKQHEVTIKDFHRHKSNGGVTTSTTINEIRTFTRKGQGSRARARTRSKGKVCGKCGTSHPPKECPAWGKNVINVEIRTTSVPNVDPNSQEEGTDDPIAHPEDVRAKTNASSPGQEVTRQPKAHTA